MPDQAPCRRHPLRRLLSGVFAGVVIALAAGGLIGRLALPLLDAHPAQVARALQGLLQQPVALDAVRASWHDSGALLVISGLRIGEGERPLRLQQARLRVDLMAWLKDDRRLLELQIRDVHMRLEADTEGVWHLAGTRFQAGGSGDGSFLAGLPLSLLLQDVALQVHDLRRQVTAELRLPVVRVLARGDEVHVGGRVADLAGGAGLTLAAVLDRRLGNGRLHLAGEAVDLGNWADLTRLAPVHAQAGHGSLRLWLAWQGGRVTRMDSELDLDAVVLARDTGQAARLPALRGLLQLRRDAERAQWQWQDLAERGQPAGRLAVQRNRDGQLQVHAQDFDLAAVAPLLSLWPTRPAPRLANLRPWGQLRSLALNWHGASRFRLRASVSGLGWAAAAGVPGLDHLDAEIHGDGQAVTVRVAPQAASVSVPGVFRQPFRFEQVAGTLVYWHDAAAWHVDSDNLDLRAADFHLRLRGGLHGNPERELPWLDVAAQVVSGQVPAARQFWPVNVMPEAAVRWLDQGLAGGRVRGRAVFRGNLGDWPFREQQGHFAAIADFEDARLDYRNGWPVAEKLTGQARFINTGMDVEVSAGQTMGNAVTSARARIEDFAHASLGLQVRGRGDSGRLLRWLRATPVGRARAAALDAIQAQGPASYELSLDLPLGHSARAPLRLAGHADLQAARLQAPAWSFAVDDLTGRVAFSADQVHAKDLQARYHGAPVTLGLRIGAAVQAPDTAFSADMHGRLPAEVLFADYPSLARLQPHLAGAAQFDIGLQMAAGEQGQDPQGRLDVRSDLVGMALTLPAPLDKSAEASQPLHLQLQLPLSGADLRVDLAGLGAARLRLPTAQQALAADVALAEKPATPPAQGLVIHGRSARLDVDGWLQMLLGGGGGGAAGGLLPLRVDLRSQATRVAGGDLGALALRLRGDDQTLQAEVEGAALAGRIDIPLSGMAQRGLTLRLERLYWPEREPSGSVPAASGPALAPAAVPPLHVWVKDLRVGAVSLGEVRLESVPMGGAMQVSRFDAHSAELQINARGRWSGTGGDSHSQFSIDLGSPNLGRMLAMFGFPPLVDGGGTVMHIEGRWPGSPAAFALPRLQGRIDLRVSEGRLLEIEPGVGRLFGLFSIRELPRRLSLDFGDIFQSGYSFNSITGTLRFADGSVHTEDLTMLGPSADVRLQGRTGLAARDYDELVTVTPHLGVAFPVVGAIAAGPVGAAAGLAVQGLLGKDVNRANEAYYRITGSWQDPVIERLERPPLAPPAPAASASAPPSPAPAQSAGPVPAVSAPAAAASAVVPAASVDGP